MQRSTRVGTAAQGVRHPSTRSLCVPTGHEPRPLPLPVLSACLPTGLGDSRRVTEVHQGCGRNRGPGGEEGRPAVCGRCPWSCSGAGWAAGAGRGCPVCQGLLAAHSGVQGAPRGLDSCLGPGTGLLPEAMSPLTRPTILVGHFRCGCSSPGSPVPGHSRLCATQGHAENIPLAPPPKGLREARTPCGGTVFGLEGPGSFGGHRAPRSQAGDADSGG